jgi:hypothetical protein
MQSNYFPHRLWTDMGGGFAMPLFNNGAFEPTLKTGELGWPPMYC